MSRLKHQRLPRLSPAPLSLAAWRAALAGIPRTTAPKLCGMEVDCTPPTAEELMAVMERMKQR